jgi:dATP pyrophosphohydrolase
MNGYKRPESVLVVIYTRGGRVLLLRRADRADFWQSVTGSMGWDERDPAVTARRELQEETGLRAPEDLRDWQHSFRFEIMAPWKPRSRSTRASTWSTCGFHSMRRCGA